VSETAIHCYNQIRFAQVLEDKAVWFSKDLEIKSEWFRCGSRNRKEKKIKCQSTHMVNDVAEKGKQDLAHCAIPPFDIGPRIEPIKRKQQKPPLSQSTARPVRAALCYNRMWLERFRGAMRVTWDWQFRPPVSSRE
jgi:hypothetical protein